MGLHVPETVVRIGFSLDEVKQQARPPAQYSFHHAFFSRLDVPDGADTDHLKRTISPL
ncbi:hypothetical protein ABID22_000331 [Pontibacter aydingkolensis]|uniref:hypothetical protein n=1 Tax=Pontibacter aydingkolensis TaxID=1911536 RepID=UPI0033995CB9